MITADDTEQSGAPALRAARPLEDLAPGDLVIIEDSRVIVRVTERSPRLFATDDGGRWRISNGQEVGGARTVRALTDVQSKRFLAWCRFDRARRRLVTLTDQMAALTPDHDVTVIAPEFADKISRAAESLDAIS